MSPTKKALALFAAGVPVRDIGPLVGITGEPLRELLTYYGQRTTANTTTSFTVRVCPLYSECRDCPLPSCALDKFKTVTV